MIHSYVVVDVECPERDLNHTELIVGDNDVGLHLRVAQHNHLVFGGVAQKHLADRVRCLQQIMQRLLVLGEDACRIFGGVVIIHL